MSILPWKYSSENTLKTTQGRRQSVGWNIHTKEIHYPVHFILLAVDSNEFRFAVMNKLLLTRPTTLFMTNFYLS